MSLTGETEQDFGITDLAEAFRSEGGPQYRAALVERLQSRRRDVAFALNAGLSPEEFVTTQTLAAALAAAIEVMVHFK